LVGSVTNAQLEVLERLINKSTCLMNPLALTEGEDGGNGSQNGKARSYASAMSRLVAAMLVLSQVSI
jgi:hypothetical protein